MISGRMKAGEALGYWVAQVAGGIAGAYGLWAVFTGSPIYSKSVQGLGADGYGSASKIHLGAGGAFAAETVLTFIFVMVILFATAKVAREAMAGLAIGVTLVFVHLIGIALTGTSVNPAVSDRHWSSEGLHSASCGCSSSLRCWAASSPPLSTGS